MRFYHIGDLHIGKQIHGYSLIEDQKYILDQLLRMADEDRIDVMILAGDIYDRKIPSEDAVHLLDDFLLRVSEKPYKLLMIPGNHDSATRLAFGSSLFRSKGIYLCADRDSVKNPIRLEFEDGPVDFYAMPYLSPQHFYSVESDVPLKTHEDVVRFQLRDLPKDRNVRNLLIAHQFVIPDGSSGGDGVEKSDSETPYVGGLDSMPASLFDGFDYVALGHIHKPQKVQRETIRYGGTPLKYSLSEWNHKKSLILGIWKDKGDLTIEERFFHPLRDVRRIEGTLEEILENADREGREREDYVGVVLTEDAEDAPYEKLKRKYPNLLSLEFKRNEERNIGIYQPEESREVTPMELFEKFYLKKTGNELTDEDRVLIRSFLLTEETT